MCIIKITVCDSTTRDSSITHYAIQQIKEVHWATSQNVQATKAKKKNNYRCLSTIFTHTKILQPRPGRGWVKWHRGWFPGTRARPLRPLHANSLTSGGRKEYRYYNSRTSPTADPNCWIIKSNYEINSVINQLDIADLPFKPTTRFVIQSGTV